MPVLAAAPPPPPPSPSPSRRARPGLVRFRGVLPVYARWSDIWKAPDGRLVIEEHVWATRGRWHRLGAGVGEGWRVHALGFWVLAHRVVV